MASTNRRHLTDHLCFYECRERTVLCAASEPQPHIIRCDLSAVKCMQCSRKRDLTDQPAAEQQNDELTARVLRQITDPPSHQAGLTTHTQFFCRWAPRLSETKTSSPKVFPAPFMPRPRKTANWRPRASPTLSSLTSLGRRIRDRDQVEFSRSFFDPRTISSTVPPAPFWTIQHRGVARVFLPHFSLCYCSPIALSLSYHFYELLFFSSYFVGYTDSSILSRFLFTYNNKQTNILQK